MSGIQNMRYKLLKSIATKKWDSVIYSCLVLIILALSGFILFTYSIDFSVDNLEDGSLKQKFKVFLINNSPGGAGVQPSKFISETLLKKKIAEGLPEWAILQIRSDLSNYKRVDHQALRDYYALHKNKFLIYFKIKNGQVKIARRGKEEIPEVIWHRPQREILEDALSYLAKARYIPDTEFIVSVMDFVDAPETIPIPLFTFAKDLTVTREKNLILMPDATNIKSNHTMQKDMKEANILFPWCHKKNRILWRGGGNDSTGFRNKVVSFSKKYPDKIDAAFPGPNNEKYLTPKEQVQTKFLLCIDGNRCTWERLVWQLFSNSLVFKHESSQVQWFYKGIKPYKHYLPVRDEEDLLVKLAWADSHPAEAELIANNATEFAENNLRLEDMYHYIAVLLQEYSKLVY